MRVKYRGLKCKPMLAERGPGKGLRHNIIKKSIMAIYPSELNGNYLISRTKSSILRM